SSWPLSPGCVRNRTIMCPRACRRSITRSVRRPDLSSARPPRLARKDLAGPIRPACGRTSKSADGDASRMPSMQLAAESLRNCGTQEQSRILLNVLINNDGIMEPDKDAGVIDDRVLVSTVATNLLGPIRLTSALLDHLKGRRGVILYNTSVLAFVPLAVTAVYSATKAALHSYVFSQRFLLRESGVRVLEVAPPWVRTELMNSQEAEQAMPLDQFISETLDVLGTDAVEILVEAAKPLRANPGPGEHALVNE